MYNTLDYWSWDMLNFDFSEKGLVIVSLPHLGMVFQEKCYSSYNLLTDQILLSDSFTSRDIGQYVY